MIATNLSTRATSVRAVIFPRLLVRSLQGQAIGYRDKVIFSKPEMIASGQRPAAAAPGAGTQEATNAAYSAGAATSALEPDTWQVVGYWNYDGTDGQHLAAQGLTLRSVPGAGLGQRWQAHLELKNHSSLAPRERSLWPVKINSKQRKVCANYQGYPSYQAFIDMPGESEDGVYQFSECNGE